MQSKKKTVVITGASSGIGLALCGAYLGRGYNVVGNSRTIERLKAAALSLGSPDNFLLVAGDIGLPATAERIFEQGIKRFGKIDILINNAGIFIAKPLLDYTSEDLDSLISTNLKGFFYASQQAAEHKNGHIVNITASISMQPLSGVPAAVPILIKGGINQATKALALELAPYNIKVTAVAPGIIDTPLYTKDMHEFLNGLQPLARIGSTQDIAAAVLYLTDAEFTTGITLAVDGGMTSGKWQ